MAVTSLTPEVFALAIAYIAAYHLVFALQLTFLPKSAIIPRLLGALLLAAIAQYGIIQRAIVLTGPPARHSPLSGMLMIHYLGLLECLLLLRIDAATLATLAVHDPRSSATKNQSASIGGKIWQALSLSCNARRIGTPWQVKSVYPRKGPQTKWRFVMHVLPRVVLGYIVVDVLNQGPAPEAALISPAKQTAWRLWTLTGEDVGFRLAATMAFWTITYSILYVMMHSVALVSVVLGMSGVEFWPHLFGPMREAYTLRGFWGYVSHSFPFFRVPISPSLNREIKVQLGLRLTRGLVHSGISVFAAL